MSSNKSIGIFLVLGMLLFGYLSKSQLLSWGAEAPVRTFNDITPPLVRNGKVVVTDPSVVLRYVQNGKEISTKSPVFKGFQTSASRSLDNRPASFPTAVYWSAPKARTAVAETYTLANFKAGKKSESLYYTDLGNYTSQLPIISLHVNQDDFFNEETGIYVYGNRRDDKSSSLNPKLWEGDGNYYGRGSKWKRKIGVEFIHEEERFSTEVTVSVNGNATRSHPQKSLKIVRKDQPFPVLFEEKGFQQHELVIRNAGNDWHKAFMRDALIQSFGLDWGLDGLHAQPVVVLVNGHYWGIHYLRNKMNEEYFFDKYQANPEEFSMVKDNELRFGDKKDLSELFQVIGEDKGEKALKKKVHLESLYDYIILETFFANFDWPNNNMVMYKRRGKKWKPALNDLDFTMNFSGVHPPDKNIFTHLKQKRSGTVLGRVFLYAMKFPDQQEAFLDRAIELFGSDFSQEKVIERIDAFENTLKSEMPNQIDRWGSPSDMIEWKQEVEQLRQFVKDRNSVYLQQLKDFIGEFH